MSVDLSKIKPGDEVSIRLKVVSRNSNGVWAKVEGWLDAEAIDLACNAHAIVSHTPRALAVGDRVKKRVLDLDENDRQRIYTITAMDADGWMLLAERGPASRVTSSREFVERVDAD